MTPAEKLRSALRRLELSLNEQQIYLSLLKEGQATARLLAARTGITRPSVYDQIKSLRSLGLVNELDIDGKTHFIAAHPKQLKALLEDKIDRLKQSHDFLHSALPDLEASLKTVTPKIRFFEGSEGVKLLLKDILWHDHTTLQLIWPTAAMADLYEDTFLKWFENRRALREISIHALSTTPPTNLFSSLKTDKHKVLPKQAHADMAMLIYEHKVACISSHKEAFGFIVESDEYHSLQRMLFATLWHQAD